MHLRQIRRKPLNYASLLLVANQEVSIRVTINLSVDDPHCQLGYKAYQMRPKIGAPLMTLCAYQPFHRRRLTRATSLLGVDFYVKLAIVESSQDQLYYNNPLLLASS